MRRFLILFAALLPLMGALLVPDADARLGGGHSFGSRGSHSYFASPSTRLSPNSAQPFQRSQAPAGGYNQNGYGAGAGLGGSMFSRHPFATGLLGGYTTFSTASFETARLLQRRSGGLALVNSFGMLLVAVAAVFLGLWIGSALSGNLSLGA